MFADMVAVARPKLRPRFNSIDLLAKQFGMKDGRQAICFTSAEIGAGAKRFEFSSIDKFNVGRPTLREIQKAFQANRTVSDRATISDIWDSRHVLIILDFEADVRTPLVSPLNKVSHPYFRTFRWSENYNPK